MVIDCHCHAGTGDGLTGPWDTRAPLTAYLRRAAAAGIHRTVLFSVFDSDYREANRRVARLVRRHPERFFGFAFIHPDRDRGRVADMVREAVESFDFRGIKVHRHDAALTREVCEAARSYRIPVLYDPMGDVGALGLLGEEYPEVDFILPHLGSFADDWAAQRAVIDHLARHPNFHTDTSGIRRFDLLEEAVRRVGAGRVLFGSDGPWLHPGLELAKVRALGLSTPDEARITGGNLLRLFEKRRRGRTPPTAVVATPSASGAPCR